MRPIYWRGLLFDENLPGKGDQPEHVAMPGDGICVWRPSRAYLCKAGKSVKTKKYLCGKRFGALSGRYYSPKRVVVNKSFTYTQSATHSRIAVTLARISATLTPQGAAHAHVSATLTPQSAALYPRKCHTFIPK